MLRSWSQSRRAFEWEKITGASEAVHDLERGAVGAMRAIDQHADAVHLLQDGAAQCGEPGVGVVTAASHGVVTVIGKQHLADAETIIDIHHAGILIQRIGAFEIKRYRELAFPLRSRYVLDGFYLDEGVMGPQPMPVFRQGFDSRGRGLNVVAYID